MDDLILLQLDLESLPRTAEEVLVSTIHTVNAGLASWLQQHTLCMMRAMA